MIEALSRRRSHNGEQAPVANPPERPPVPIRAGTIWYGRAGVGSYRVKVAEDHIPEVVPEVDSPWRTDSRSELNLNTLMSMFSLLDNFHYR